MTNDDDAGRFEPRGVDLRTPNVARIYDYYLGGDANWAIDRKFADAVLAEFPMIRTIAKANRQFLFRVVRHLMRRGVRQFVDIGAGIPTMGHVHAAADLFEPGTSRVVYVDNEPVAVAHSQMLLEAHGDPDRHAAINADLRDPDDLWDTVLDTGIVDPDKPLAVLMIAVLHVQQLDHRRRDVGDSLVARYRELIPPGSYLAISHASDDRVPPESAAKMARLKQLYDTGSSPVILRTRRQIEGLFGDFTMIDPGIVWVPQWHPEETATGCADDVAVRFADPGESIAYVGVGRKP